MDILAVIIVLLVLLAASAWSSARSYFVRGRLAGMEEATLEIIRGVSCHYQIAGQAAPDPVNRAIDGVKSFARGTSTERSIDRYRARLWNFGDAIGVACWRRGYQACGQRTAAKDGRIRIDLSIAELMHLTSLAHLGFKKMMPNDRGIEMLRFDGADHAIEVAHAVERLERAIPEDGRPRQHCATRQELIQHWWPLERKRA